MKIENTTDVPTERLKEIIAFVKPNNLPTSKFTVQVTNSSRIFCGKFYEDGWNSDRPHIIVRVTADESRYPYRTNHKPTKCEKTEYQKINPKTGKSETWVHRKYVYNPGGSTGGYIDTLILSREEALVNVMAHELRHLWQSNHPKKRSKVWGARGQYSDRDADYWAIRKMREWRRLVSPMQVYPESPW